MRRDRSKVVAVEMTRFFIGGRGYSSRVSAYMQLAKRAVREMEYDAWKASGKPKAISEFAEKWYAERYPVREGCNCSFCHQTRTGRNYSAVPKGRGCWISKMADYRKIAREIIEKEKRDAILPAYVTNAQTETLALPATPTRDGRGGK